MMKSTLFLKTAQHPPQGASFTPELKQALPEATWPWVFSALRQERLVWDSLQGELGRRALARTNPRPEDFSPAALALLALDSPARLEELRAAPLEPLDGNLRQRAARVAKAFASAEKDPPPADRPALTFLQAGLLALHLRERRSALDAWEGLAGELARTPAAVLACLYGMIPDPQELLLALALPAAPSAAGRPAHLALQALFSNPLPPEAQSRALKDLLGRAPVGARVDLLRGLAALRPELAAQAARSTLADSPALSDDLGPAVGGGQGVAGLGVASLPEIWQSLEQAEIYGIAGQPEQELAVLEAARQTSRRLQACLAARAAGAAARSGDPQAALAAWQQAADHDPDTPGYLAGLAAGLLEAGRAADAQALLSAGPNAAGAPALLTLQARLAALRGDIEAAREYASQAAAALEERPDGAEAGGPPVYAAWLPGEASLACQLARLLLDLDRPQQAAEVAHRESERQAARPEALMLSSQALVRVGAVGEGVEAAHLAVALAPGRSDYRRQLAESLEALGDWEAALVERSTLLARQEGEGEADGLAADLRALANCALRAGRPEQAVQACQKALHFQPDNGLTYTLLGQAAAAQGDEPAALAHLQRATQLTPDQAAPWLALAGRYGESGQPQKALEALQTAARAAPDAPEVHLALGEAYLDQKAPTQALVGLRRAADLAHGASPAPTCLTGRIALRLGQTLLQLGHLPEARQVLEGAYRLTPGNPELAYGYAQALLALGQQRAAIPPLETALAAGPAAPEPYLDYARSLLAVYAAVQLPTQEGGKGAPEPAPQAAASPVQKAIAPLRRALELAPDHAEAKGLLAEALAASGELLPAMEAFRRALDSDLAQQPTWQTRLALGLGQVALKIGQIETAIAALQEANAADPLNPSIQRTLSEAYDAAGLAENAFQAARAAVLLAPGDIDVLTWFADQALELRSRPGMAPSQAQTEAINALNQASSLAPQRTDLLIRMGQVQMQAGEAQAARNTFSKLAAQQRDSAAADRNSADLYGAATHLLRLGDAPGAVTCLELALQTNRRRSDWTAGAAPLSGPTLLDLLTHLATARYQAGQPDAALDALEQALVVAPQEASLYLDKADLHLEMSQPAPQPAGVNPEAAQAEPAGPDGRDDHIQAARACLVTALQLKPGDPALHQRAALIQRAAGDLPAALDHAEKSLHSPAAASQPENADGGADCSDLSARGLAGDLARAQFQFKAAREFVRPEWPAAGSFDPFERIDYYCLRAELALEAGEPLFAADDLGAVLELAAEHPRVLALQARLAARRGDLEVAQQMLRDAVEALSPVGSPRRSQAARPGELSQPRRDGRPEYSPGAIRGVSLLNTRTRQLNNQLAAAETAVELQQWETGLQLLASAAAVAPLEPFIQLRLARALVLRAEFQGLCQDLEVIRHAPGERALRAEASEQFEAAIQTAAQGLSRWVENPGGPAAGQACLGRWRARGQAAFRPNPESAEALGALPLNPEDVAARVACLRKVGNLAAAGQAARAYPQHPRVLMQLALALATEKPRQALAAAHAAVELVLRPEAALRPESQPAGELPGRMETALKAPSVCKEDVPLVHVLLARLVHACGNRANDTAVAVQAIGTALSAWPDEPRWHALAAEIYAGRAPSAEPVDWPPVIYHLEQAIRLEPKHAAHYVALGQAHLRAGAPQRAVEPLEQATRLAPDLPEPWLLLAQALRSLGDLDQAAARAERAVTLAPEAVAPLLLRGEIALAANSPRGALSRAQAALHLSPADPAAQLLLARALSELNRPDEALAVLDKALPQTREPLPFQIERARLLLHAKGQEAALEALHELADLYPGEPNVLSLLAGCLADAGQREAAIQTAQRALRAGHEGPAGQPVREHANTHFLLGRLLRRAGQLDAAVHHLTEAIQHAPGLVEAYLELGHTHQERRQYGQALSAYQQAAGIAPSDPRGYYHAGLAFKESKDYLSAESMLRKAANLAPEDLSIHRLLAAVVALNLVHNRRDGVRETSAREPQISA